MPRLPRLSGREVVQVFTTLGWEQARQSGSHVILVREGRPATLSIPDLKEVAVGTLRSPIRSAGLTAQAFIEAAGQRRAHGRRVTSGPSQPSA